jgi:excinuclease ABC subunit A
LAPLLVNRKGEHRELLQTAREDGLVRLRVDGVVVRSDEVEALDKRKKHHVEAVVDRFSGPNVTPTRLQASVEQALKYGKGTLIAWFEPASTTAASGAKAQRAGAAPEEVVFSERLACESCGVSFPELTPQAFSFNSPQGMCKACNGLGSRVEMDPSLIIPDDTLSIDGGAIAPWGEDASEKKTWDFRGQMLEHLKLDPKKPVNRLSAKQRQQLLYGTGDKKYEVTWATTSGSGSGRFKISWEGVIPRLMRRFRQTQSERARKYYAQFLGNSDCSECGGSRMRVESAAVQVARKTIVEVSRMTVTEAADFFSNLKLQGARGEIAAEVLKELSSRIGFLSAVGLGYLSLDRAGPSLSGGEAQRIRLASQVGSELTGVIYVLDEPSIGLHQRDNQKLLKTLFRMRDIGNTVVCVEHDEDTIRAADHVIDFGPGAGVQGGKVIFSGTPEELLRCPTSSTGAYLSGKKRITPRPRRSPKAWLTVEGARENNLKDINASFPLGVLVAVTGVSGAGKSTLVNDILCPALARQFHASTDRVGKHKRITGVEHLDRMISIDQRPIGRTPRSNPATYIKVFDEIRTCFAALPEARARGYTPGRFSFNVKGGRCESCEGDGVRKIEMHFLADVYVKCEECAGKRYNQATLEVSYKGKSISDVLELTVAEALELFNAHPSIAGPLRLLAEVGLEYMPIGQPSPTLSGGEAQRIKLARELAKRATGRTIYVLDEPTTGLHFEDIVKLLDVLHRLVDAGNSVIVIEHNLDVIKCADHLLDLGPEGGPDGGQLIASGSPEEVAKVAASHTGRFLKRSLKKRTPQKGAASTVAR